MYTQKLQIAIQTQSNQSQTIILPIIPKDYDSLINCLQNQLQQKISNEIFKYQDCDNDVISIENTIDLLAAYEHANDEEFETLIIFATFDIYGNLSEKQSENFQQSQYSLFCEQKMEHSYIIEQPFNEDEIIQSKSEQEKKENQKEEVQNLENTEQMKKFCELFTNVSINSEKIFLECEKCKYYKEGIVCQKCKGKKTINPNQQQCNLINEILNLKMKMAIEQLLSENKKTEN